MTSPHADDNPRLQEALSNAERGWPVLPIFEIVDGQCACGGGPKCSPGKHPRLPNGFKGASLKPDKIREWWTQWPDANIGIATGHVSNLLVIDVDTDKGGEDTLAALEAEYGPLPDTPEVITGGGGRHVYLQSPETRIRSKAGDLGQGVDHRADGGYVLGALSSHKSGRIYEWESSSHPDDVPLAPASDWLVRLLTEPKTPAQTAPPVPHDEKKPLSRRALEFIATGAPIGQQRETAVAVTRSILSCGYDADETAEYLWRGFQVCEQEQGREPWTEKDARAIASDLASKAPTTEYAPATPSGNGTTPLPETLPFKTIADLQSITAEKPEWIIEGLAGKSGLTELAGKVKCGKSTVQADMARSAARGEPFLGLATKAVPVVILTEERPATFRALMDRVGITAEDPIHVLFRHDVMNLPWEGVMELTRQYAREVGAGLLFVDTCSRWANIKDDSENSAGAAASAIEPLELAAADGLAVVIIRHDRKSGGDIGDSGRGSSAFSGGMDVVLRLQKANVEGHPNRRVFEGVGRFDETPATMLIEYQDGRYVCLGDAADVERRETKLKILDILPRPNNPPGPMASEITDRINGKKSTVDRSLKDLVGEGLVSKNTGAGQNGRGFGYTHREVGDFTSICTLKSSIEPSSSQDKTKTKQDFRERPPENKQDFSPHIYMETTTDAPTAWEEDTET